MYVLEYLLQLVARGYYPDVLPAPRRPLLI